MSKEDTPTSLLSGPMKGVLLFLIRFLATYLILSVVYGQFISHYDSLETPEADPITHFVTRQTVGIAELLGYESELYEDAHLYIQAEEEQTYDTIHLNDKYALSIEEGCNAVNVMILFLAFVIGFGGKWKAMTWFLPLGLLIVHIANIGRLLLLAIINVDFDGKGYHFYHKYFFTAILYVAIFLLWVWWVNKYGMNKGNKKVVTPEATEE